MLIPFLDLKTIHAPFVAAYHQVLDRVLNSGRYLLGDELRSFEQEWGAFCSLPCVAVGSGLDALTLGLRALDLPQGSEVLVPGNTFVASALSVHQAGLRPVLVDVDPLTGWMTPETLERARTAKTQAVMVVHLYGRLAPMADLMEWCHSHQIHVLEDAAQAHGAECEGHKAGYWGRFAAFSFYPGKNLGCLGDGGGVISSDEGLLSRIKRLRNYGSEIRYVHEEAGINSRLDEIQAGILRYRLQHLSEDLNVRRSQAAIYGQKLEEMEHLEMPQPDSERNVSAWHLYVIRLKERRNCQAFLTQQGIETLIHYPIPLHRQKALAAYAHDHLPGCDQWADQVLSLPLGAHLSTELQMLVVQALEDFGISASS